MNKDNNVGIGNANQRVGEIQIKLQRIRDVLSLHNIDAILLKRQDNFSWCTAGGINTVTISEPQGIASLLISKHDAYVVTNNIELPRIRDEEQLVALGFEPISYDWSSENEDDIIMKMFSPQHIGCDCYGYQYQVLEKEIRQLRYPLLPEEIQRYLWLGEKASYAIETVLQEFVQPGMKESEVMGELSKQLWKDRIDSVCFQAASDERAFEYRHGIPTEKKIDSYLMLNINARKWGLITTVTRSLYFGDVDPGFLKQYGDTTYIECGMISYTRPGSSLSSIFEKTCELYEERGYPGEWKHHHQGGAQGYANRDYLMTPNSQEKVLVNQCFCWNPTIRGTKSEDAIIVRDDGPVFITKPMVFPTIDIEFEGTMYTRPAMLQRERT